MEARSLPRRTFIQLRLVGVHMKLRLMVSVSVDILISLAMGMAFVIWATLVSLGGWIVGYRVRFSRDLQLKPRVYGYLCNPRTNQSDRVTPLEVILSAAIAALLIGLWGFDGVLGKLMVPVVGVAVTLIVTGRVSTVTKMPTSEARRLEYGEESQSPFDSRHDPYDIGTPDEHSGTRRSPLRA